MAWTEIFRFFYILGVVNALFFSVLIFAKKERSQADNILASWLIALSLQLLFPFFYLSNLDAYMAFAGYEILIFTLHPAFLLNYVKAVTGMKLSASDIMKSFILTLVAIGSLLPFFILPIQIKIAYLHGSYPAPWVLIISFLIVGTYFLFYILKAFRFLKNHKNHTLQVFSYRDNVNLLWLRRILVMFTVLFLLSIPVSSILYLMGFSMAYTDYIYYASLVFFIFFMGFWGYQQGAIFQQNPLVDDIQTKAVPIENNQDLEQYHKSAHELARLMEKERPYLEPSLTLHQLAALMNVPPHQLSRIINKSFQKNFFEFVNDYRIHHFKEMVTNPDFKNFTLLGIALESGFNSKSAFNRIFKEQTGITPGEYKNQISGSNS